MTEEVFEVSLLGQKGLLSLKSSEEDSHINTELNFSANLGKGLSFFPKLKGDLKYYIKSVFPKTSFPLENPDYNMFSYTDGPPGGEKTWTYSGEGLVRSDGAESKLKKPFVDPAFLMTHLGELPVGNHDFEVLMGRKFLTLTVEKKNEKGGKIRGEDREITFSLKENKLEKLECGIFPMVSLVIQRK